MMALMPSARPELELSVLFIMLHINRPRHPPFVTLFLLNELIHSIRPETTLQISFENRVLGGFGHEVWI